MTLLELLRATRNVIPTPRYWSHADEDDDHGGHCLIGAVKAVSAYGDRRAVHQAILDAIKQLYPERYGPSHIPSFNDHPKTRHRDVLRVLDAAIEAEEAHSMWNELRKRTKRIPRAVGLAARKLVAG